MPVILIPSATFSFILFIIYFIHVNMENKECISCDLEQKTGINVSYCYQCGKCTAGCVLSEEMDYAPSYILRLLQTKNAQNELMQIVHYAHFEYFLRFVVDLLLILCIIIYI